MDSQFLIAGAVDGDQLRWSSIRFQVQPVVLETSWFMHCAPIPLNF